MGTFFADYIGDITFPDNQSGSSVKYRQCQKGAYWAIKAHKTTNSNSPATISLPTGGGKTAVMMLAAFEYGVNRALIIVPSDALRGQVVDRFDELKGLNEADAFSGDTDDLEVHSHEGRPTTEDDWESHTDADVVVSTPNSVSEVYANADEEPLVLPPDGFFDLLMVDEAHHTPAPGWREVLESFDNLPQLLFTATPFRREDQPLPGELIYHYPIEEARDDCIYHEVGLDTVIGSDQELIEEAAGTLRSLQESNNQATLLARTDEISKADELLNTYSNETALELRAVHSETENNRETLEQLRDGAIDGVVVVNKFTEGLDVANLQVAVFHEPPKSFPKMVQIIGRLARKPVDGAPATIIATEEAVQSESMSEAVRQLYRDDTGWADVADELISEYLSLQQTDSSGGAPPLDAVSPDNIRPYKTVTVYTLDDTVFEPFADDSDFDVGETDHSLGYVISTPDSVWGCITTTQESPTWGTDTILQSKTYNLHLYCSPDDSDLLFEYTSDSRRAKKIRGTLVRDQTAVSQIEGKRLSKAMQSLSAPKFRAAGMNNVLVPSGTQPEHKLLTGTDVQGAVYHSDARQYTHGHVFASFDSDTEAPDSDTDESESTSSTSNTRGISNTTGSIWSNSKGGLSTFQQWCVTLAEKLTADREPAIQHFGTLNQGDSVDILDSEPFSVVPFPALLTNKVEVQDPSTRDWNNVDLAIGLDGPVQTPTSSVEVCVSVEPVNSSIQCTYDIATNQWSGEITDYQFRLPDVRTHSSLPGDEFLRKYPPRFHVDANTAVMGGAKYAAETTLDEFDPSSLIMSFQPDWSDYIDEEAKEKPLWWEYGPNPDANLAAIWDITPTESVFSAMVEILTSEYGEEEYVLFCGDMGDEIADFIDFRKEEKQITFYHCKRSYSAGVRVNYFKDIYHQTLRSLRYTYKHELVDQISDEHNRSIGSHIIRGKDIFEDIRADFVPSEWDYTICGVHPGLKLNFDPEANNENVGRLLSECTEQVERYNVDFAMVGAGDSWK
ncbi:DEAD/DEAH box helicase [Natronoarchaeum mannanilyticum]|uniref:Superfamily II DNA or RNA helicase n=1 Tax=Natronoarchaeum mannanilyticum TaxID=926360 RepID=A0AAV3TC03_9EURY